MGLLSIQISAIPPGPGAIHVRIENPIEGDATSELPFDGKVALPAILKALEAADLRLDDFDPEELNWLRTNNLITDHQGRSYYSQRLREEVGRRLFFSLFPTEKMRGIYDQVRRESTALNEEVQFQLRFDAGHVLVGAHPWELLHNEQGFLCGGGKGTLTRYLTFDTPPPVRSAPERLKVLLVAPRPTDPDVILRHARLVDLGDTEALAIQRGVKRAQDQGYISLEQLPVSSFSALEAYLRECSGEDIPHILHFDGHGAFGRRCPQCGMVTPSRVATVCSSCEQPLLDLMPQGYLAFEDAQRQPEYKSAQEFAALLRQVGISTARDYPLAGICLVVLSACRSAVARGGESIFNGVAQALMDARVPAVVAMQFSIWADKAADFAEYFYRSIAKREPLVTAVSWGRTVLGMEGDQWYRPVLYLRWRDNEGGQLFAAAPRGAFEPREEAALRVSKVGREDTGRQQRDALVEALRIGPHTEGWGLRRESKGYAEWDDDVNLEQRIHWNREDVAAAFVGAVKSRPKHPWRVIAIQAAEDQGLDTLVDRFERMCETMDAEGRLEYPLLCAKLKLKAGWQSRAKLAREMVSALRKAAQRAQMQDEAQRFLQLAIDIERHSGEGPGRQSLTSEELAGMLCACLQHVTEKAVVVLFLENCQALLGSQAGELLDVWFRHYICEVQRLVVVATAEDGLHTLDDPQSQGIRLFNPPRFMQADDIVAWAHEGYRLTWLSEAEIIETYQERKMGPKTFRSWLDAFEWISSRIQDTSNV